MIHLKTINSRLLSNSISYNRSNPSVDLPSFFIAYQTLRDDAVSQNLITITNDKLADVQGRTQSPYLTNYAFAGAPSLGFDDDGVVTFFWRTSLFVNSSTKALSNYQVDFDDGAGYRTVSSDVAINIVYTSVGKKDIKFRTAFTDGTVYFSHAGFSVLTLSSARSSAQARYNGSGAHDYLFPRQTDPVCPESFANPETWQGTFYGATVTIEYGTIGSRPAPACAPQFIKPFIVVEGYDAGKFPELATNFDYGEFIFSRGNGGILVDSDPSIPGDQFLGDRLEAAGYDLIFIDFNEGTGDIIRNAFLVENIIRWVNAHKIVNPNNGIREGNVVLGQSMGGLVSRYAVCDLEKRWSADPVNNPSHEVRLLVTQDSPHRGANVPLGFQALVNDLAPYRLTTVGLATYGITGAIIGSLIEVRDIVPPLDQADKLLDEPASQQMLVVQDGRTNTFLDGAYRNMITFSAGFTPSFNMRALSNGSECGAGQILQPGGELLYADANLYVNRLLFLISTSIVSNSIGSVQPGLGVIAKSALYALVPFTGKKWKTKFVVNAAPSTGTNQAFYGNISFEKKILFVVPININLFGSSRNSQASDLPWDSAPGGYYWLRETIGTVPGTSINAYPIIDVNLTVRLAQEFNFVPTVSALDITTSPITQASLTSPFTGGSNASYPSRFPNFITQERDAGEAIGSLNNSRHIQFTVRNSNWLFNQMQGINQIFNCNYLCSGTPTSPFISGPDAICTGNFSYSLNNPPGGVTFNWTNSTNLSYVSGQGTTSYTVTRNSNGSGFVQTVFGGACGNSDPVVKNITVGLGYNSSDYPVTGPSSICTNQHGYYNTNDLPGATNYSWFWPSSWQYGSGQGTRYLDVYTTSSSTSGAVGVRVATACDPGGSPATLFTSVSSCGAMMMTAYPNPTQDELIVEPATTSTAISTSKSDGKGTYFFRAKLFNANGEMKRTANSEEGRIIIKIKDLPDGQYYLSIETDLETVTSQILINR